MIRGRAAAGDTNPLVPLAARPQVLRALQRAITVIGAAGLSAALLVGVGDDLMSAAAQAAVSGGGPGGGGGSGSDDDVAVTGLASSEAVEAAAGELLADGMSVAVEVTDAAFPLNEADPEELLAAPVVLVTPAPAPTPPPAPTTTVPPPPPAPPPAESVEGIIMEIFGEHGESAIGVARCESGLNPGAISRGGGNWGLFQINTVHKRRVEGMGYRWEDVLDARVNTLVAHAIFTEQGWGPWGCRHAAY